ncbi:D-2-hydroxyacid dehydrogenase [Bacillus suaedaesalsae]|uniref:D-2-hydroxyacid dehydrogenase n=1 Tax=Bacillus suaedaesalsae TaxID=2810349 RepID=A0ABS2DDB3_9BACI|nr:D-2-hydroxyacid dehydrogenase [Bacillus suaedaesalsae]MBM6616437.1 D-2-hydroxyacid dehydrogenase [Bacillus suaedaesalsae]
MNIVTTLSVNEKKQNDLMSLFKNEAFHFFSNAVEPTGELKEADVVVTYGDDITPEMIKIAEKLKWIMVMSAGVDKLPFQEIKKRNILVTNVRGIHKIPMAEYTMGMMLQVSKHLQQVTEQEKSHEWKRLSMNELYQKNVCIIGVGAIGGQIAKLCKAFGMNTYGINTSGKEVEFVDEVGTMDRLEEFLAHADFVVSILPSTQDTKYLLTKRHFQLMQETSIFINIGRGDVIQESVLLEVLNEKLIGHAILDVFENEPLAKDHPFWGMDNVTVTPHISSITSRYLPRAFAIFEENLRTFKSGGKTLINQVNVDRGY